METATYLAELLVWSTAHLVWQAALACAVFRLWSSTRSPSAEERHTVALAMLASLPTLVIATALVTHLSLVLNAREGSVGALKVFSVIARLEKLAQLAKAAPVSIPNESVRVFNGLEEGVTKASAGGMAGRSSVTSTDADLIT